MTLWVSNNELGGRSARKVIMSKIIIAIEYDDSYGNLELSEIETALYNLYAPGGGFKVSLAAQQKDALDLALPSGHSGSSLECMHPFCVAERNPPSQ